MLKTFLRDRGGMLDVELESGTSGSGKSAETQKKKPLVKTRLEGSQTEFSARSENQIDYQVEERWRSRRRAVASKSP